MSEETILRLQEQYSDNTMSSKHPFGPFFKSFLIFGIDLEGNQNSSIYKTILLRIWTVVVVIFYHYWIVFEILWYTKYTIQENALAESIVIWSSVLTFDILLWKRRTVHKFMAVVKLETLKLKDDVRKKHEKMILIMCCLVWLYSVVFVLQDFALVTMTRFEKHHTVSPISYVSLKYVSGPYKNMIFKIDTCMESFFIQGLLTLTIALYLVMCLNAIKWFQHLKEVEDDSVEVWKLSDIQRFFQTFSDLSENVQLLDKIFSKAVGIWLIMILAFLCIRIVTMINPNMITTSQMVSEMTLTSFRATVTLVGITFIADSLHQEAMTTLFYLDDLMTKDKIATSNLVYHEIHMAFTKFSYNPIYLTLGHIIRLNRKFLMTCVGMMTTYVIISIQLYPNTMKGLASGDIFT